MTEAHNTPENTVVDIKANKETIISLLKTTGRENIDCLITWLDTHAFFDAPASKSNHNAFPGGLAKHSLDVYNEAIKLNASYNLPTTSVTLCALLHDVCKADQFYIDVNNNPRRNNQIIARGHGIRSMFIVARGCGVPLNYDEALAIWWHMGDYENSKEKYPAYYKESKQIPLCRLIHEADDIAANCEKNKEMRK